MRKGAVNLFCFFTGPWLSLCGSEGCGSWWWSNEWRRKSLRLDFFYDEKTHACVRGLESGCCQSGYRQFV